MKKNIFAFFLFLVVFISLNLNPPRVLAVNCYAPTLPATDCKVVNDSGYIVCELPGGTHQCCDIPASCDALKRAPPTCASQNPAAKCYPNDYVCLPQNPPINPKIGCTSTEQCGVGCVVPTTIDPYDNDPCRFVNDPKKQTECTGCAGVWTAIGCITTNPNDLLGTILRIGLGLAGGIAFLLILFGGLQIMTSAGNPEHLNAGRELITSAIVGLILILFSIFLLQFIGINIIGIPGFVSK